jgi:hypothetical protein
MLKGSNNTIKKKLQMSIKAEKDSEWRETDRQAISSITSH